MSGLNIPFKTSPSIDFATPLGKYITATYGKKSLKSVQADLVRIPPLASFDGRHQTPLRAVPAFKPLFCPCDGADG